MNKALICVILLIFSINNSINCLQTNKRSDYLKKQTVKLINHTDNSIKQNFQCDQNILGNWKLDNESLESVFIGIDTVYLTLEYLQVHVYAKLIHNACNNKNISVRLISPDILGSGGIRLKWNNFSKEKDIAIITSINADTIKFEWLGFYDKLLKKRVFKVCGFTTDEVNWSYLVKVKP